MINAMFLLTASILMIVLNFLTIFLLSKLFGFDDKNYGSLLGVTLITTIVSVFLYALPMSNLFMIIFGIPVFFLASTFSVKLIYSLKFGRSALIGFIWVILFLIYKGLVFWVYSFIAGQG